jgi:hypothetical protein
MKRSSRCLLGKEFELRHNAVLAREEAATLIRLEANRRHQEAMASPAKRLLGLLASQGESHDEESGFAFGDLSGGGPRARIPAKSHPSSRTLLSRSDPFHMEASDEPYIASDEPYITLDDDTEEALPRREPLSPTTRSMSPLARQAPLSPTNTRRGSIAPLSPATRSISPVARLGPLSPAARQEPLSSTIVGTSDREEILSSPLSRLTPAHVPSSPLAKNEVASSGYGRAGGKIRALKASEAARGGVGDTGRPERFARRPAVFARKPPQPLVIACPAVL